MRKSMGVLFILAFAVSLLFSTELVTNVSSQASGSESVSVPAIAWQKDYGYNGVDDEIGVESASNLIQTSDGGYVFMDLGWFHQTNFVPSTIYKVNSSGGIEWKKTIKFLNASTIIQTNDEGYEISGRWSTYGTTYTPTIIKTDSQGTIQWVANYSSVPDLGVSSTMIQTSDGGFAYWTDGSVTKTDSKNNTEWIKILTYPTLDAYPTYIYPLKLSSLIETSDGALAALGVGYRLLNNPLTGKIYLIKTESFLPLPSQAPLPTPLPTPSPTLTVEVKIAILVIVVAIVVACLLFFLRKRKH